jgi:hypothetical protein
MNCIVMGCTNNAKHNIGIRLRRPGGTAIWAPNTRRMSAIFMQYRVLGSRLS